MDFPYKKMFSPYRLSDTITLKNRVTSANGQHAQSQGPETWPSEIQIAEMADFCNGASLICFGHYGKFGGGSVGSRTIGEEKDKSHIPIYDYEDPAVQNYLCQVAATAHMYGTKIIVRLGAAFPKGCTYGGGDARSLYPLPEGTSFSTWSFSAAAKNLTREQMLARVCPKEKIKDVIDDLVAMCKKYKKWGWDGMSFRVDRYIDADTNLRTDEYNGEIENRGRFVHELFTAIKKEVGQDFLVEAVLMGKSDHGHDYDLPHGYTQDEVIRLAKMIENVVDIFQIREETGAGYQNGCYNSKHGEHKTLDYCRALKDAGIKSTISANTGFMDAQDIENALESGACDLIAAARAFIADPQFMQKIASGTESPTPCLRCNKCHGFGAPPWLALCSVNPKTCMSHRLPGIVKAPLCVQKVAVIGGGPIGMRTACYAAERGHKVTLYEKTGYLGGKLKFADLYSFKWSFKQYREWLIEELGRRGVEVKLNHEPTPSELQVEGYNAIIACTGSRAKRPDVEGADAAGVWTSEDVYEGRAEIGQKVVVVGGGEVATETAMYLAEQGKDITILTRSDMLMKKEHRPHGPHQQIPVLIPELGYGGIGPAWANYPNFKPVYEATTLRVTPNSVTYVKDGVETTVECDSVVVNGGYQSCIEEALQYGDCAPLFYLAGDVEADVCSNLQQGNVSAFGKACLL